MLSPEDFHAFRHDAPVIDFDFLLHRFRAQTKQLQQFGQGFVAHLDVVGHSAACRGQRKTPVFFIIDKPALGQPAHHIGEGRAAQAERGRYVRNAGVTLLVNQFVHPFQMIFGGLRSDWASVRCVLKIRAHLSFLTGCRGRASVPKLTCILILSICVMANTFLLTINFFCIRKHKK